MMKRKLVRILALILALVTVFALPVSAVDMDNDTFFQVLDYSTAQSGSNFLTLTPTDNTAVYQLPNEAVPYYIDIVLSGAGATINGVSVVTGGQSASLTVVSIGWGLYRIYGKTSERSTSDIRIVFNISGTVWAEFQSVEVSFLKINHIDDVGSLYLNNNGATSSASMSSSSSSVSLTLSGKGDYIFPQYKTYYATVESSNWKKYDYLDFVVELKTHSIDSITSSMNGVTVPLVISYLSSSGTGEDSEIYNGVNYNDGSSLNLYTVTIRMDLRGLDRTASTIPVIKIAGLFDDDGGSGYVKLVSVNGYVQTETVDPVFYYFRNLQNAMSGWFAALQARQDAAFNDQVQFHTDMINGFSALQTTIENQHKELIDYFDDRVYPYLYNLYSRLLKVYDLMVSQFTEMQTFLTDKFTAVTDRLDKLIGGTSEGDELSQGAAEMGDQIGEIQDYEEEQQAVLDDNFETIQDTVTLTGFTAALAFVQRYINLAWAGIGDFSIIYTLPIFIGLFFFICGRIPGATRWSSRPPKDGDST